MIWRENERKKNVFERNLQRFAKSKLINVTVKTQNKKKKNTGEKTEEWLKNKIYFA